MGYSKIPKLPRNKYNYTGPSYSEASTPNALLKAANASGGNGGGTVITNTTLAAMSKVVQQYADEKGFVTSDSVKTINGYSIVGSGDIEVTAEGTVDLSAYATKAYVNSEIDSAILSAYSYTSYKISEIPQADLSAYATKTYVNDEVEAAKLAAYAYAATEAAVVKAASYAYTASEIDSKVTGFVTYSQLSSYVTKTQLDTAGYVSHTQLTEASYATKSYVSEKIEAIPQADLSAYATKAYVNEKIEAMPQADLSSYVTKTELEQAGYLTTHQDLSAYMKKSDMSSYATKTYVATKAQEIISSSSYITSNDVSNMGYVTTSVLSQASYVTSNALDTKLASYMKKSDMSSYVTKTELENAGYLTTHQDLSAYMKKSDMSSYVSKTELNNASYVPQSQLSTAGYATSVAVEESLGKYVQLTYLDDKLTYVVNTYAYSYEGTNYTAKETDGVVILKAANTTLTLPTEGITEGKMITVINKTGSSFQAASSGGLINKDASAQQPQQRIPYMVSQYIYIEGDWYIL